MKNIKKYGKKLIKFLLILVCFLIYDADFSYLDDRLWQIEYELHHHWEEEIEYPDIAV